ncbi:glycosyltransferase family 39 protein [Rathayibacter tritici]|uniref:glycosyltransferase family 39 protein n=1 Tax=Rathayibacter tritici TaxID=33888 RepID=UPI00082D3F33|nr:glycosyltransferase family 39 protein [Rathayibacter tritici]
MKRAALIGTVLWALYQCFGNLSAANISSDEPVYLAAGWDYLHGDVSANLEHPPVAKYLIGLAQVLLGEGLLAGRIAAGTAAFLTGAILWLWFRSELGSTLALIPAGLFLLFPRTAVGAGTRIDRLALLEPFMVLFAVAAMAAAWTWSRASPGRRSGWLIALAGALLALSVTSKLTTAVLVPVFLLPLLRSGSRGRTLRGALAFAVAFVVTGVLAYLPVHPVEAIPYLLDFQSEHNAIGHLIEVAGSAYVFPPWWANLWFMLAGIGPVALAVLLLGALLALLAPRRRALVLYLGGATLLLLVFHVVVSSVALPHYYAAWAWLLCALAGIGIAEALRGGILLPALVARGSGAVLLAASIVVAAATSAGIAEERPTGIARVADVLRERGLDGGLVLAQGMSSGVYVPYLGDRVTTDPSSTGIVAIAIAPSSRFPVDPRVTAYLESAHPETVRLDDLTLVLTGGPLP